MLIPAIDLKGGKVVQLIQGERLAIETTDLDHWIRRFSGFPRVNVIDLDAAMSTGSNDHLVREICRRLPCQVGGGVRSLERAFELGAIGARKVILGSALFRDGQVNAANAKRFADALGADRVIGAVDSKAGKVVTHGWTSSQGVTAIEAVRALEPFCGEFLYTHVDREGLMGGTDVAAITAVRNATRRRLIAAGGVTTQEEIDELDLLGIDAVVGMAIYTGALDLDRALARMTRKQVYGSTNT
jgi:phosphoribosylformimino-5-aminoimidazole carboxamide ribotide isomerase